MENVEKTEFEEVKNGEYELIRPKEDLNEVLVLFGGYPEKAEDIKREFKILETAKKYGIAVVFMNYNQKLWLKENEKQKLAEQLQNIFTENDLPRTKTYFGGFSSGGNIALLISDFLTQQNSEMTPKGIRFYSEPDTLWWKQNRMADFDQMNAYYLERLSRLLKKSGFKQVEYIATENKGYRANGERHPHSWSIVDKKELIEWIAE